MDFGLEKNIPIRGNTRSSSDDENDTSSDDESNTGPSAGDAYKYISLVEGEEPC